MALLMKAGSDGYTGTGSKHVVPSFYEGGDDVTLRIKNGKTLLSLMQTDELFILSPTITTHSESTVTNFNALDNDKLARNAYYAICEKAMMDYMRSVAYTVKDSRQEKKYR